MEWGTLRWLCGVLTTSRQSVEPQRLKQQGQQVAIERIGELRALERQREDVRLSSV